MHQLYVSYTITDARSQIKKKQFQALGLKSKIGAVRLADCYTIDAKLDAKQIEKAGALLANPLMQSVSTVPSPLTPHPFSHAIEVSYLPGVTDNIGHTAKETLSDGARVKFKPGQNVYSSQVFFICGNISGGDVSKIAHSLHNPLIQKATITSYKDFKKNGLILSAPKVKLTGSSKVTLVDLNINDDELIKLGKLGILEPVIARSASDEAISNKKKIASPFAEASEDRSAALAMTQRRGPLALSLPELKAIQNYFSAQKRSPTDIELETLAQTWSEHCKHTIFADPMDELSNGLYKTYIKAATETIRKQKGKKDFCVSVFSDNAGGISFNNDYIISHKVETHNTPSALDPFGGSITGIGGVNRDAIGFGLGGKPIANFYGFCLADPNDKTKLFRDKELKNPMLSAKRIMEGVIAGINAGGNQSGIPTPLGFLHFDSRFRGKPLVFAGTLGLTPKKIGNRLGHEKRANPGDLIVVVGGRVGADGIHGATFSSEGLDPNSPATAVQIGDPITQKKLSDAIIKEARGLNLYNSITDCGAGGLSSAVGEMAKEAGGPLGSSRAKSRGGCEVSLDKVPLKYPGLAPWQIWISESQERMVLSVPPSKWKKFEALMKSRGVEATVIGKFIANDKCIIKYNGKTILEMEMEFLHNGRPKKQLVTQNIKHKTQNIPRLPEKKDYSNQVLQLLSGLNIASREFVSNQYDHEVQGSSVLKPLQGAGRVNSKAAVIKPVASSKKAAVLSYGLMPSLSEIDSYAMAAASIDSAIRAAVAAGADVDYLALLDNFCWCSPEDPKRLWQLKEAVRACYDTAVAFGTPFISGKDSMYNDFKGFDANTKAIKISIPPTLLITTVGVIPDATKAISLDAKLPGDLLYILGSTHNEMAGSEFVSMISRDNVAQATGLPPRVDAQKNLSLYRAFYQAAQNNLIASAISVNTGGLATALCKTLIAGGLGAEVTLENLPGNWQENHEALFSESQGRIVVSVDPKKAAQFEKLMLGNDFAKIGTITRAPKLIITDKKDKQIVKININQMLKIYKATFKDW